MLTTSRFFLMFDSYCILSVFMNISLCRENNHQDFVFQICVNDDLVAKKFAYYIRESADSGGLDEMDQSPVMLSSSILTLHSPTRTTCTTTNKPTAQTQPLPGKRTCHFLFHTVAYFKTQTAWRTV